MTGDDLIPPAPAANPELLGHDEAQARFLAAFSSGRLHHGWLIAGPKGIGKATLAYRIARFLLSMDGGGLALGAPPASLAIAPTHPVFRQVVAGSHPDLRIITPAFNPRTGEPRGEILVDDVRGLGGFLGATAAMGGWRVVIVDAADALNANAANAILKLLEEPPARTVFLLVAHSPGALLPTLRSRCLHLPLKPLSQVAMDQLLARYLPDLDPEAQGELGFLSAGSPGLALRLAAGGGDAIHGHLRRLFMALPRVDLAQVHALAGELSGKRGAEAFATFSFILQRMLADSARARADPAMATAAPWADALPLGRWLSLEEESRRLLEKAERLNLEARHVVLNLFANLTRAA
ncbi:MAG: DNA polymerase III subunit delta' [Pseudomonadota bacterium]